jgi:tripartite-type tricarboxylate transporter receptor subunit TctC
MRPVMMRPCLRLLLVAIGLALAVGPLHAAAPITLAISSEAGGGEDQYARLLARYLQRELPGKPPVVPRTMVGASGVLALNWAYNSAPRDGTVIVTTQGPAVLAPLQGNEGAQFDPRLFGWLGSIGRITNVLIAWHSSPVASLDEVFKTGMVLGNGSSDTAIVPAMMNRMVGTRFKIIAGYAGTNAVALAMERGEVDGTLNLEWGSLRAVRADWLAEKKIRILMQVTFHPVADLPDVPALGTFVRSPEDREILSLLLAKQDIGRPFLTPPGEPPEIVAVQQAAFLKIARDPDFLADADKLRLAVDPTPGPDLAALIARLYAVPRATSDRLRREMERAKSSIERK